MASDNQPAFRVYSVISRGEGKDDYWLNIGLAFPHNDGKGFNVMLQAFPLDGKLVLRETAEDEKGSGRNGDQGNVREYKPHASSGRWPRR